MDLDGIDEQLLRLPQRSSALSHAILTKEVRLSTTRVHKRLKRLRQEGYIKESVVLLERASRGLDLLPFLTVTFKNNPTPENLPKPWQVVQQQPEVSECYTINGHDDTIALQDHVALREFLRLLSETPDVIDRVETCILLEEPKASTALPIGHRLSAAGPDPHALARSVARHGDRTPGSQGVPA